MTEFHFDSTDRPDDLTDVDRPLESPLRELALASLDPPASDIPRDMMWARIRQQRRAALPAATPALIERRARFRVTRMLTGAAAIAATLAIGVAIGRYGRPSVAAPAGDVAAGAPIGDGRAMIPNATQSTAPAVVAMEEHLANTVTLLAAVRANPTARPAADASNSARALLITTRMLLDEPQLTDARTRQLLQDIELVLVQIMQARGSSVPAARRAPSETIRETNLLLRVRALVTASASPPAEESSLRGVAE